MTFRSVDLQVSVPRVGEVEKINRTLQGQQQTDQQIMGQALQEDLNQQARIVQQNQATEQKKIKKEAKEKKEGRQKEASSEQSASREEKKEKKKKGRYLDLKV